jgi:hypothetical protein
MSLPLIVLPGSCATYRTHKRNNQYINTQPFIIPSNYDAQYHTKITVKDRSPTNLFSTSPEELPRQFLAIPYYTHGCLSNYSGPGESSSEVGSHETPLLARPDVTHFSTLPPFFAFFSVLVPTQEILKLCKPHIVPLVRTYSVLPRNKNWPFAVQFLLSPLVVKW